MRIKIKKWFNSYNIDTKYKILLVLAALHDEKIISDDKLKGQFASLRKGTLQGRKGTYHCTINNRWYNCEPAEQVFRDCLDLLKHDIVFSNFIPYIAKFEQKGNNYALNVFLMEYIKPLLNEWNPEYHTDSFSDHVGLDFPITLRASKSTHECYSCGSTHTTYDKNERKIADDISAYFHSMKKGNLKKIPFFNFRDHPKNWQLW